MATVVRNVKAALFTMGSCDLPVTWFPSESASFPSRLLRCLRRCLLLLGLLLLELPSGTFLLRSVDLLA